VRREFDACLREKLPQFHSVKPGQVEFLGKKEIEISLGDRLYLWNFSKDLYFYLLLVIAASKMGDRFTVEGAWTQNARFPSKLFCMSPHGVLRSDIPPDSPQNGDMRFRLGGLFPDPCDHWWWVAPRPSFDEFNEWILEGDFEGKKLYGPIEMDVEKAMKNIKPCVRDAINKIIEYVIPYFEDVIAGYKKGKVQEQENNGVSI